MTISRVNPNGFFKTTTLTSTELNQLDTNITYGIDKRNGQTDAVSSDITINSLGSLTFESGATLNFDNPADLILPDGTLAVDCKIVGNTKPLRLGFTEFDIGGYEDIVMGSAYYINGIIKLVGELTIDCVVTMPTLAGYSKIIDNACTGNYRVTVKTAAGGGLPVYLPNGKSAIVYCDGVNIIAGPQNAANNVLSIQSRAQHSSGFGVSYQAITHTSASPETITDYYFSFADVLAGDQFDISYTVGLESAVGHFVATRMETTDASDALWETEFRCYGDVQRTTTISTLYTCLYSHTGIGFYLTGFCDGTTGYINTPLSMVIKHIR